MVAYIERTIDLILCQQGVILWITCNTSNNPTRASVLKQTKSDIRDIITLVLIELEYTTPHFLVWPATVELGDVTKALNQEGIASP